ncbi:MAG TPA: calcium-binding protein, partial [Nocardioidaceae bacterium]|nr:calcium-binding protein [Nocardioidaceae bacterium]
MQNRRSLVAAAVIGLTAGVVSTPPAVADAPHSASAANTAAKVQLCHGKRATIVGTPRKDRIIGTNGRDVIVALDGTDRIFGKGGNDWICGKGGNDRIYPGAGSDHVEGGQNNDVVRYSTGDDVLDGGGSPDTLDYARAPLAVRIDGRQRIAAFGRGKRDHYQGFENFGLTRFDDTFRAGGAGANVFADDGDDVLVGGHSQDIFNGGDGDDRLDGGLGDDGLTGGLGADRMVDLHGQSFISDGAPKRRDRGGVIRTGPRPDELFIYPGKQRIDTG